MRFRCYLDLSDPRELYKPSMPPASSSCVRRVNVSSDVVRLSAVRVGDGGCISGNIRRVHPNSARCSYKAMAKPWGVVSLHTKGRNSRDGLCEA